MKYMRNILCALCDYVADVLGSDFEVHLFHPHGIVNHFNAQLEDSFFDSYHDSLWFSRTGI